MENILVNTCTAFMKFIKSRKTALILLGSVLFLSLLVVGLYPYFKNSSILGAIRADKYSNILDWCSYTYKDDKLIADCKALLLDIRNNEEGDSCFDMKIVFGNKELRDFSACEKGEAISYANEVLGYKKLLPINLSFEYTREGIIRNYSFNKIFIDVAGSNYTQSMISKDITELISMDLIDTTIKNSINFCPKPELLPEYLSSELKILYKNFYTENTREKISDIYDVGNDRINAFFTCYYTNDCEYSNFASVKLSSSANVFPPQWGGTLSLIDYTTLAQLSYFYAGQDIILPSYGSYSSENTDLHITTPSDVVAGIVDSLSWNQDVSEEVYCTLYQAIKALSLVSSKFIPLEKVMKENINQGLTRSTFPLCYNTKSAVNYDQEGVYIMYLMSMKDDNLKLLNRCLNLANLLQ
jgi:hypothetical protein